MMTFEFGRGRDHRHFIALKSPFFFLFMRQNEIGVYGDVGESWLDLGCLGFFATHDTNTVLKSMSDLGELLVTPG